MRRRFGVLAAAVAACAALTSAVTGNAAARATSTSGPSTVVAVRAAQHPGFDRLVFQFRGGLPVRREVRYVPRVLGGGSGEPIQLAGAAKLQVSFRTARADDGAGHPTVPYHTAYALKSIHEVVISGDLDGVASFGVGLARATPVRVFTLRAPDRVVIDISTQFRTVPVQVWLVDQAATGDDVAPTLRPVTRSVVPPAVAAGGLHRLFAGATPAEQRTGLRSRSFTPTGWTGLSISGGIARVRLTGSCDGQADIGLAEEIMLTLKQFPTVAAVKIYDPSGQTQTPDGAVDSVPWCLRI